MNTSFIVALQDHSITAQVVDCDHYRIHGGLAVETDYIIIVQEQQLSLNKDHESTKKDNTTTTTTTSTASKICFHISKTYSEFRMLVQQLKTICDVYVLQQKNQNKKYYSTKKGILGGSIVVTTTTTPESVNTNNNDTDNNNDNIEAIHTIIKYCTMIYSMIDTQRTTYLGKVNYTYVQVLSKQRTDILNHVLTMLLHNCYPTRNTTATTTTNDSSNNGGIDPVGSSSTIAMNHTFMNDIANVINTFFLTDHVTITKGDGPAATVATVVDATNTTTTTSTTTNNNNNNNNNINPLLWIGDAVKNVANTVVTNTTALPNILTGNDNNKNNDKSKEGNTTSSNELRVDTTTTTTTSTNISDRSNMVVVPMSQRNRRSILERDLEETTLLQVAGQEAKLIIEDTIPSTVIPSLTTTGTTTTTTTTTNIPKTLVPNYNQPVPTVRFTSYKGFGKWIDHNPYSFVILAIIIVLILHYIQKHISITIDGDLFLLCIFGAFCIGLHTPRPLIVQYDDDPYHSDKLLQQQNIIPKKVDRSGRLLLRQSMIASKRTSITAVPTTSGAGIISEQKQNPTSTMTHTSDDDSAANTVGSIAIADGGSIVDSNVLENPSSIMGSPMAMFPEGAELGTHLNCWSRPDPSVFQVRGPNYLSDKKKIPAAAEYIFPCRGIDLFLTDTCPQDVGTKYSNILMGGKLRDVPTFIINFRLPWGILLFYCEIPLIFVPFIEVSSLYGTDQYDTVCKQKNLASILDAMTPSYRTVARWCMKDTTYKNQTLKIVPVVVDGPWVVKSVVGGKPAIIGSKLPISYVYQPESDDGTHTKALYLEADLDIAASSAARGILSVTRSYTQILTMNLGFVIQGNTTDELPEQMLTGARLHGVDPLTAPSLPSNIQDDIILQPVVTDEESD